jgi:Zn-dependent protease with chaperone function
MTKHQAIEAINEHLEGIKRILETLEDAESSEAETQAVLRDHPDILERVKRLESGQSKTIPIEEVAKKYGVKL